MKRLILILTLTPLLILAACAPSEEDTPGEDADSLESAQEMQDLRMDVEDALAEADRAIDSLQVQMHEGEMQAEVDSAVADLQVKRDSLQANLQELQMATQETWDDLKSGIEEEIDELESAVQAARQRYQMEDLLDAPSSS